MKQFSTILRSISIAAAVCLAFDASAQQNIVADGGFEDTPPNSDKFSPAWTLIPASGPNPGQQFSNVGTSATFANSGENYANLAPEVGQVGTLRQTLNTTAGQSYTLSFFLTNDSNEPVNFFRAVVNGTVLYETMSPPFPAPGPYQLITRSFVAQTSSTTLDFQYQHDDDFWRLDDVSVTVSVPQKLLNISTRLRVQTGENVLIGGFILTGTAPKRVIIRAIGPSLERQGVREPLADPVLELYNSASLITTNDNWKDMQRAEIEATGIPPADDRESAIVVTLPANGAGYTAIVRGKDNTTGVALVEVYDLAPDANSELANISSRGFVSTGENVMIGGFFVGGGDVNARIVVRAIGPSLANRGVENELVDPTLQLVDRNGNQIQANDNWRDTQQAEIQATGLQPSDDRESALVASLPADEYTAIVRGKDGTTGVGLVEVYNIR
ncbi:MAG: hypothetical protein AVDCRST_MAG42-3071 [uncultured Chthoniobacterales bacterium]|uniref:DUF642 domain-containing protein n=1 Tax=uncultured Chthoniobacterales bacterium TaxID=1836801 RepID=A0A6J4J127_9BACT|nr:MAG: hypothetical protein AVDCRST_MAG42-3071 [uncultured Chthoniobacterales bacterium]